MGGEITDKEVVLHHPNGTVYHFPAGTPASVIEQQKAKLAPKPEPTWLQKAKDWATTTVFPETFKGIQKNTDQLREWLGRVRQVPYAGQRAEPLISAAEQASAVGQGVANAGAGMTSPVGITTVPLLGTLFAAGTPGWMLQGFASAGMGYNAAKGWQEATNLPAPEKTTARTEAAINALFGAALAKNMLTPVPRVPVSTRTTPPRRFVPTAQTARAEVLPSTPAPTPTPAIAARPEPVQPKVSAPYQRDPAIVAQEEALAAKQAQAKAAWEALARGENPRGPAPGGWDTTPLDQIPEGELGLTGKQPTDVMGVFTPQASPVAPKVEPRPVGALGLTGEAGPAGALPPVPEVPSKPPQTPPQRPLALTGQAGPTRPLPKLPETGPTKLDVAAMRQKYPRTARSREIDVEPEMVPVLEEAITDRVGEIKSVFEELNEVGSLSGKTNPILQDMLYNAPVENLRGIESAGYGKIGTKRVFPELEQVKGSPSDIVKAIKRDKNNKKYLEIRDAALSYLMNSREMGGKIQGQNEALKTIKRSGGDSEAIRLLLREGWEPEDVLMNMEERKGLRGEEGYADITRQKAGYIGPGGEIFPLREGRVHTPQTGAEYGATYRYWPPFSEGESGTLAVNFRGVPSRTIIDAVRELVSDTGADLNWEITQNNRTTHYGMNLRGLMSDLARIRGEEGFAAYGRIDELSPDTAKEMERLGIAGLGSRMVDTTKDTAIKQYSALGSAGVDTGKTIKSVHVTDNPKPVEDILTGGKPITEGRREGKYGDLGRGLYSSAAPEIWMGRATGKWDFLKGLDQHQRMALAEKILDSPGAQRPYVTANEAQTLRRWMNEFVQLGNPGTAIMAAEQPYNISFWKPDFLESVGIKPGRQPKVVSMESKGRFIDLDQAPTQEQAMILKSLGFDGAYVKGGFSHYPQMVVWNNDAVESFGNYSQKGKLEQGKARLRGEEGSADISKKDQKGFDFTPVDVPGQQKGQAAQDLFNQILQAKDSSVSKRDLLGLNKKKKAPAEPPKGSLFDSKSLFGEKENKR